MPNATYPATLPLYVQEGGYSEQITDQTVESQMDSGPAKIRRRFTKSLRKFEVSMAMTAAQVTTFETFWNDTLKGGSLPFDWLHPRTRAAATLRFRLPAPRYEAAASGNMIIVSFVLEII